MIVFDRHIKCLSACVLLATICVLTLPIEGSCQAADDAGAARFHERIQPILETYCYGCHAYGAKEGNRAFDEYKSDEELIGDVKLWLAVLKNVRAGVMPPPGEAKPTDDERRQLYQWIETGVFKIDSADPDPGRVTVRRLNRVEYRNTVRDLTGVDYDTTTEFPPDDAGYGFDNIGDSLSLSPLLMEKYIGAARAIVAKAAPDSPPDESDKSGQDSYRRIFVDGPPSANPEERDTYAQKTLRTFVRRAYRRPVDDRTVDRLVAVAKNAYTIPDHSFESGVGAALVAVLSSPRFLYRIEEPIEDSADEKHPLIDEFALASRLSYFLWSTMPDDELLQLAEQGELRANFAGQVNRMLKDQRSASLAENFAGQWLRSRDIEHLDLDPVGALGLQPELDDVQRQLTQQRREREAEERQAQANPDGKSAVERTKPIRGGKRREDPSARPRAPQDR